MKRFSRKTGSVVLMGLLFGLGVAQLKQPALENPPVTQNMSAPPEVGRILRQSCYDCHSNETRLKWFDKIAPASWLADAHIREGRAVLNFSEWDKLTPGEQKAKLFFAINDILAGEMPLKSYQLLHPEAKLTEQDVSVLKNYLLGLSPRKQPGGTPPTLPAAPAQAGNQEEDAPVEPALNGIAYIPGYQQWKAISTTDRFDNGTMRVIYANAIAAKAIADKQTNPWPDGAVLAKAAWAQRMDSAGVIRTGEFIQVEYMIRNRKKYADTQGWGWARWKGKGLKPYGKTRLFTNECISCHRPRKANDYVFTLPLTIH